MLEIVKEEKVEQIRTTINTIKLTGGQIIQLLIQQGFNISPENSVIVMIPGGGNYSNMPLDIDLDTQVEVSWTEVETKEV